jgi:HYR domain-containing protein
MRFVSATIAAMLVVVVTVGGANPARRRSASSELAIDATLATKAELGLSCPPGTPALTGCYPVSSREKVIPGLGATVAKLEVDVDRNDPAQKCSSWTVRGSIEAAKGSFAIAGSSQGCQPFAEGGPGAAVPFTVTGGEGAFVAASGDGVLAFASQTEASTAHLTATLIAPGYSFDTTAPTLTGVRNIRLRSHGLRPVRVRYRIGATDDVDGTVLAVCTPASGHRFRPGRTRVRCSATDSSGNSAHAAFTVTVTRKRA